MVKMDGKATANKIKAELKAQVDARNAQGKRPPHLVAIIVGGDSASEIYVAHKMKACKQVGFLSTTIRKEEGISEGDLLREIRQINQDNSIDGLIVQLPLPAHINEHKVIEAIAPEKDVDGFHPQNLGKMVAGIPTFLPATPAGILELLRRYEIPTEGKHCVVLGRSNIVGTPTALLMSRKTYPGNATVTLCHSRTRNLMEIVRSADIVVAAIGLRHFVTAEMVKEGATVIDVGIHRIQSDKTKSGWKLYGDVDYEGVAPKAAYITPVPGGVGPMTIVSLLKNTLQAATGK